MLSVQPRFKVMAFFLLMVASADAQTRDELVRADRESLLGQEAWYYDDLAAGRAEAVRTNKPLMVVLRCIP